MRTYKFRAECFTDAWIFINSGLVSRYKLEQELSFPDVVVTFSTKKHLTDIVRIMKRIPDPHVMLDTIKPVAEYTGERTYSN